MKVEITDRRGEGAVTLSSVNFGQFATDSKGRIYFAPNRFWLEYNPETQQITNIKSGSDLYVYALPVGTQLTLTSVKY